VTSDICNAVCRVFGQWIWWLMLSVETGDNGSGGDR
jgi:hypothetical protein